MRVMDIDHERARRLAHEPSTVNFDSLDDLLNENPTAVYVTTPNSRHLEPVMAAEDGLAVIVVDHLRLVVPAVEGTQEGQDLLVFVRPNDIDLLTADVEKAENIFDGVVNKLTYLGDKIDYRVVLGETLEIRVQTDGKVRFNAGENVKVRLPLPHCRVIAE